MTCNLNSLLFTVIILFQEAISEKDLAGAKSNLKAAIHIALENQDNVLMELGSQVSTPLMCPN